MLDAINDYAYVAEFTFHSMEEGGLLGEEGHDQGHYDFLEARVSFYLLSYCIFLPSCIRAFQLRLHLFLFQKEYEILFVKRFLYVVWLGDIGKMRDIVDILDSCPCNCKLRQSLRRADGLAPALHVAAYRRDGGMVRALLEHCLGQVVLRYDLCLATTASFLFILKKFQAYSSRDYCMLL